MDKTAIRSLKLRVSFPSLKLRVSFPSFLVFVALPHLGAKLRAEELADLSGVALEGEGQVHHVEDNGLDAVAAALHFPDDAWHLVPAQVKDGRAEGRTNPQRTA